MKIGVQWPEAVRERLPHGPDVEEHAGECDGAPASWQTGQTSSMISERHQMILGWHRIIYHQNVVLFSIIRPYKKQMKTVLQHNMKQSRLICVNARYRCSR